MSIIKRAATLTKKFNGTKKAKGSTEPYNEGDDFSKQVTAMGVVTPKASPMTKFKSYPG